MTFESLGLKPEILSAVEEMGFQTPTPVQEKVIPTLLDTEKDLVALAQTGTGKTAAFGLPLIHLTKLGDKSVQALVLSPTRELCMQIADDLEKFGKHTKGLKVLPVYGGSDIGKQIRALKSGVHIVVGTPGRVLDLVRRNDLDLSRIRYFVLDEADEMLNMGFKDELDGIEEATSLEKQTLLFSATMPAEIRSIAQNYMLDPEEIKVGSLNEGAKNISHEYYQVFAKNRYKALKRIVDLHPKIYGIVFCRTRRETKEVADKLIAEGYNADALNGDLSQALRTQVMNRFKKRHLQLLVATDVAARGVDVDDLTHVIHYNLPDELEVYIHRSGRTARAGKSGTSVSIINTREYKKIYQLEKLTGKQFEKKQVPSAEQIVERQLFSLIDKVEKMPISDAENKENSQVEAFMPIIFAKLGYMSKEDLIRKFVAYEFQQFSSYYKDAPDLNVADKPASDRKSRNSRTSWARFILNIGSNAGLKAGSIIAMINELTQNRDINIGHITIKKKFSTFEVGSDFEAEVVEAFKNAKHKGHKVFLQKTEPYSGPKKKSFGGSGSRGPKGFKDKKRGPKKKHRKG